VDTEILARQLRFTEQVIGRSEPLARHLKPRPDQWTDLAAARDYVKRTIDGSHHYVGTCSMMPRAMGGVVDERLRVHGCSNLRVCDASVVPIIPVANTQAVVYGLAELGASLIKEDLE
jgi:choline dehydrogenase-like flavoprotein